MGNFDRFHARNHTVIPGVGAIHTQGVANAYVSSLEHTFLADGAEKPVPGRILFGVRIADDGSTHWVVEEINGPAARRLPYDAPRPTESDQTDFPAEAVAEMRRLSETLEERDPTGWFFDVLQRAEDDLKKLDRARADLVRGIEHLGQLLSDPAEPRTHFVSKEECGKDKGFFRDATDDERAARRAWWSDQVARKQAKLVLHDRDLGPRTAMLRAIVRALREWSGSKRSERRLPSAVVAEAVAALFVPVAA